MYFPIWKCTWIFVFNFMLLLLLYTGVKIDYMREMKILLQKNSGDAGGSIWILESNYKKSCLSDPIYLIPWERRKSKIQNSIIIPFRIPSSQFFSLIRHLAQHLCPYGPSIQSWIILNQGFRITTNSKL